MWYAKNLGGYSRDSIEAAENSNEIYSALSQRGWTLNSVCAILGNMEIESGYNPWRWESDDVLASTDISLIESSTIHGYGLAQFTPSGKYILSPFAQSYTGYSPNFSDISGTPQDGNSQILFIDEHADYYPTQTYPISYQDFKTSTATTDYLTAVWLYNYERPADPSATLALRQAAARYWHENLSPTPPTPTRRKSMPLWMMIRKY